MLELQLPRMVSIVNRPMRLRLKKGIHAELQLIVFVEISLVLIGVAGFGWSS